MSLPVNQIVQGDCLEVMKQWPDKCVDVVITDPPYGVNLGSHSKDYYASYDDTVENLQALIDGVWPELVRLANRIVLTPGVKNMRLWPKPDHVGAIYYPSATGCNPWGFSCWQPIYYYGKDPFGGKGSRPDSFQSTEPAKPNGHPCPKPIGQMKTIMQRVSNESDLILDPFCGSGTTCVAAELLGRKWIGIELDPNYCQIARDRIEAAKQNMTVKELKQGQMSLLEAQC